MNTKRIMLLSALAIAPAILMSSCQEDEILETATSSDSIEARMEEAEGKSPLPNHRMIRSLLPINENCEAFADGKLTTDDESYPKTYNRTPKEGKKGMGSHFFEINVTDDMTNPGAIQTTTIAKDGKRGSMSQSVVITNVGSGKGDQVYSVKMSQSLDGKRGEVNASFEGTLTLTEGADTETCEDDVFSLTGSGTREGKETGTMTIEGLTFGKSCKYPTAGTINHSGSRGELSIDFGEGDCDSAAMVTKDGEESEVDLSEMRKRGHGKQCENNEE